MWQNIAKSFQTELNDLSDALSFAPAWAIWGALLVSVFVVACLVHAGVLAFLHRLFRSRRPYLNRVLVATKNPIRLALLLLALAIALPTAPLGPGGKFIFVHCLALGTICLIGWISSEGAACRRQSLSAQLPHRRSRQSIGAQARDAGSPAANRQERAGGCKTLVFTPYLPQSTCPIEARYSTG